MTRDELKEKVARALTEAGGDSADIQVCRFDPVTRDYKDTPLWREALPMAEAALAAIEEAGFKIVASLNMLRPAVDATALPRRWPPSGRRGPDIRPAPTVRAPDHGIGRTAAQSTCAAMIFLPALALGFLAESREDGSRNERQATHRWRTEGTRCARRCRVLPILPTPGSPVLRAASRDGRDNLRSDIRASAASVH